MGLNKRKKNTRFAAKRRRRNRRSSGRENLSGTRKIRDIGEMVGSEILDEIGDIPGSRRLAEAREMLKDKKVRGKVIWVFAVIATLALSALVGISMFQSVTMQESSMEPTLSVGEKLFINRILYRVSDPRRGDIVFFKSNGSDGAALHIRRVIGLPGETVQIIDGQILINGETYKEGKDFPTISNAGSAAKPVALGEDEFFVLGDNRNNSEDSRHGDIGKVQKRYIVGKLWFVSSPLNKLGFLRS